MSQADDKKPMLANLVNAGDQQTEAIALNDFVYQVNDISNVYLVTTSDGDVMINTGFMANGERNKSLLDPVRTGALKAIILTQSHADHYGCVPAFQEEGTKIIAGKGFFDTWKFFDTLGPYLKERSAKLWKSTIKGRDLPVPKVIPDVEVESPYRFDIGNRTFEVIPAPGGEAPDGVVVWLPTEKIVFTGNLFGPVFMAMPNLCTMRGDKPRSAALWLKNLSEVRDLGAELLITGHGEPIVGADKIRSDLDRMHGAVSYIHDKTVEGMNAGKDVYTLMTEIKLPEELQIGEFHGKVSWAVRTIWEEYSGWFHMESTTSLYAVPRSSINTDLMELAGSADAIAERAQSKVDEGKPLEAIHLVDISLGAEPQHVPSLKAKKAALQQLLKACGGSNLSETMWLKTEISACEAGLGEQA